MILPWACARQAGCSASCCRQPRSALSAPSSAADGAQPPKQIQQDHRFQSSDQTNDRYSQYRPPQIPAATVRRLHGWEHAIKIEHISPAETNMVYPRLLDAKGACTPEDIGGVPGYHEFLEAIADPGHQRHAEITEYYPANFDPHLVDLAAIDADLATLAKRWNRKPAKKKSIPK
jgi:hypothetical protein